MNGVVHLLALKGVALLVFTAIVSAAATLAHRRVAAWARSLPPPVRARVILAWAAVPVATATALVVLALGPSIGAALGVAVDHCPEHAGHVHLCLHHLPAHGSGVGGALGLVALALVAAAALVQGVRSGIVARRLARAPSFELPSGVGVVESTRPFALTVGWVRPRVLVSTALFERLTDEQLSVVIAHEQAHAARRDALAVSAARVLSLAHLPHVRREILAELSLACEQACDEAAARECGDRVFVAETIVAAERAAAGAAPPSPALAFGGGEVESRVEYLLASPVEGIAQRRLRWILLAAVPVLAAAAPHVHHWTETVLDHLLH